MLRDELEQFLADIFQYADFQDYCQNGLQIEGKEHIRKIAFGVSFNMPLLQEAMAFEAEAIIVHHGFFGKNFFRLRGIMREKVKLLLQHDISLFGIHLPLDAHRDYGNNAQLFAAFGGTILEPYDVGFVGTNPQQHSLVRLLDLFHQRLHPADSPETVEQKSWNSVLIPKQRYDFVYFDNGPNIPQKIAIISGGSAKYYHEAVSKGVDTFIGGSVDEPTPAMSYETGTNFISLGHYWSEKPGIQALQKAIEQQFDVETIFIEIENMI